MDFHSLAVDVDVAAEGRGVEVIVVEARSRHVEALGDAEGGSGPGPDGSSPIVAS